MGASYSNSAAALILLARVSSATASCSSAFFKADTLAVGAVLVVFRGLGFQPALRLAARTARALAKSGSKLLLDCGGHGYGVLALSVGA